MVLPGLLVGVACPALAAGAPAPIPVGPAAMLVGQAGPNGWGIALFGAGDASFAQPSPAEIVFDTGTPATLATGYSRLAGIPNGLVGDAVLVPEAGVRIVIRDSWTVQGSEITIDRRVAVQGSGPGGFDSALTLPVTQPASRDQVDYFAPGNIYGSTAGIPVDAIGGADTYGPGYQGQVRIREDRLAAPIVGFRFADNTALSLAHSDVTGETTAADGADNLGTTLVDSRFRFGSLGADQPGQALTIGFWYPGSEGEVTYPTVATFPGTPPQHNDRLREHPLTDGLRQHYTLKLVLGQASSFPALVSADWLYAWNLFAPAVRAEYPEAIQRVVIDALTQRVYTSQAGRTGITEFYDARDGIPLAFFELPPDLKQIPIPPGGPHYTLVGFIGRQMEDASYLLQDAGRSGSAAAQTERADAVAMLDTFTAGIGVNPPTVEGFDLDSGSPFFYPVPYVVHLRTLTDEMVPVLNAYQQELGRGVRHANWLQWVEGFASFLLAQQQADGGFPNAWASNTGVVADPTTNASYEAVPFLLRLSHLTGKPAYRRAALRAGEQAARQVAGGQYAGATIDQGNNVQKEAAVLAAHAFMAIYDELGEPAWLRRAEDAALSAETWVYIVDWPMPVDDPNTAWQHGVPTVGLSLDSTGGSGVDEFMAGEVDLYAHLYALTGNAHDLDVARVLLHDTNNMLARPGNLHGYAAPGLVQENWSIAAPRGGTETDSWYPWIAAATLKGILQTKALDRAIYDQIK